MAKKVSKSVQRIWDIFEKTDNTTRQQWQYINQKGFDFSNDNQLTENERINLENEIETLKEKEKVILNKIQPLFEELDKFEKDGKNLIKDIKGLRYLKIQSAHNINTLFWQKHEMIRNISRIR